MHSVSKRRSRALIGIFIGLSLVFVDCFLPWPSSAGTTRSRYPRAHRRPRNNILQSANNHNHEYVNQTQFGLPNECTRRQALAGILAVSTTSLFLPADEASAGNPQLDSTGQLFAPKSEMLRGGSEQTRGVPIKREKRLQAGQTLQNVYNTRFIAYLARFLLNFDPAVHAWWAKQGLGDSWEEISGYQTDLVEKVFSEFAESVEIGLADYFVGPYGSYSSVPAAIAGMSAAQPVPSQRSQESQNIIEKVFRNSMNKRKAVRSDGTEQMKQGVLNLYALLKARYTTLTAKKQLAILFSFIAPPLQPTQEIAALLGEADIATISKVDILKSDAEKEALSRTSSRRGGGYSLDDIPIITVDDSPPLGDDYKRAEIIPIMKPTSRVLKINLIDGGAGYDAPPTVTVSQAGVSRVCQAAAIVDRNGSLESILVLDPGYGYGGRKSMPPKITIDEPSQLGSGGRRAKAVAMLEYEIQEVKIIRGGKGYVETEPPRVKVTPPKDDPDWFLSLQEQPELRMLPVEPSDFFRVKVSEMTAPDGNVVFPSSGISGRYSIDDVLLERLQRDPLEMLPSSIRPERVQSASFDSDFYSIPALDRIPQYVAVLDPRYRAYDPVFGGVGIVPVQMGALQLTASEYGRLALSGAVCTVVVRTALNPLELIKTKQQLGDDEELLQFARLRKMKELGLAADIISVGNVREQMTNVAVSKKMETLVDEPEVKIGSIDLIKSMVELRGPLSLFQSADITFLASIAFGSFGFGATELFRRSFTASFFSEGDESGSEIILLLAAGIATVVTAAAASPLELLRVRSMGLIEPKKWTRVLQDFINKDKTVLEPTEELDLRTLKPRDILPLWAGFSPTLSRELPFAIAKFLIFDLFAKTIISFLNSQIGQGALPVQVGVGPIGLAVSAISGAVAGIAGAIVSHPADLILTKTSSSSRTSSSSSSDWRAVVKELIGQDGNYGNLFLGIGARSTFFFLVIGLQFFLYDYVKNLFQVGSDDLNLVLDVFFAVRAGLVPPTD